MHFVPLIRWNHAIKEKWLLWCVQTTLRGYLRYHLHGNFGTNSAILCDHNESPSIQTFTVSLLSCWDRLKSSLVPRQKSSDYIHLLVLLQKQCYSWEMANSYTACRISIMVDMSQISTEPWFHFSKYLIIMYVDGVEEQLTSATWGLVMILNHSLLTLSFF